MKFYNENDEELDLPNYEPMERQLAEEFVADDDCVLELGARYGTVSVTINKILKIKKIKYRWNQMKEFGQLWIKIKIFTIVNLM